MGIDRTAASGDIIRPPPPCGGADGGNETQRPRRAVGGGEGMNGTVRWGWRAVMREDSCEELSSSCAAVRSRVRPRAGLPTRGHQLGHSPAFRGLWGGHQLPPCAHRTSKPAAGYGTVPTSPPPPRDREGHTPTHPTHRIQRRAWDRPQAGGRACRSPGVRTVGSPSRGPRAAVARQAAGVLRENGGVEGPTVLWARMRKIFVQKKTPEKIVL